MYEFVLCIFHDEMIKCTLQSKKIDIIFIKSNNQIIKKSG